MILFELQCAHDHRFEAWFRNGDTYEQQAAGGLVVCPVCGDKNIRKAPMAPSVLKGRPSPTSDPKKPSAETLPRTTPGLQGIREMLKVVHQHVRDNFDYVGERFPEEARKIHYGETEERPIYGEADQRQAKEMEEEGIPFAILPVLPSDN